MMVLNGLVGASGDSQTHADYCSPMCDRAIPICIIWGSTKYQNLPSNSLILLHVKASVNAHFCSVLYSAVQTSILLRMFQHSSTMSSTVSTDRRCSALVRTGQHCSIQLSIVQSNIVQCCAMLSNPVQCFSALLSTVQCWPGNNHIGTFRWSDCVFG